MPLDPAALLREGSPRGWSVYEMDASVKRLLSLAGCASFIRFIILSGRTDKRSLKTRETGFNIERLCLRVAMRGIFA